MQIKFTHENLFCETLFKFNVVGFLYYKMCFILGVKHSGDNKV